MSLNYLWLNPSSLTDASLSDRLKNSHPDGRQFVNELINVLASLSNGDQTAEIRYGHGGTAASGTLTLTYANIDAGETVKFGAVTLTVSAGAPANENEFRKQTDATVTATNLKNCINAHSVLSKYVVATSATNVVTVTSLVRGKLGSLIGMACSDATGINPSSSGLATGGTAETISTFKFGVA